MKNHPLKTALCVTAVVAVLLYIALSFIQPSNDLIILFLSVILVLLVFLVLFVTLSSASKKE